jgi:SAM-dependent methyltransferase
MVLERARLLVLLSLVLLQGMMMLLVRKTAAFQSGRRPLCTSGSSCACASARMLSRMQGGRTTSSSTRWFCTSVQLSHLDQPSRTTPIFIHSSPFLDTTTLGSTLSNNVEFKTRYTIDYCPRTDPLRLQRIVDKHVTTLDRYLDHKPIAQHTLAAYQELCRQLQSSLPTPNASTTAATNHGCRHSIVLDSGCGTGRSSLVLGRLYPQYTVVGVDRSVSRLSKQTKCVVAQHEVLGSNYDSKDNGPRSGDDQDNGVLVQQVASNVWLVRAELTDFWRLLRSPPSCALQSGGDKSFDTTKDAAMMATKTTTMLLAVVHHYLLYPNPYPKQVRLNQRWYAHASFPILMQLRLLGGSGGDDGGGSLTVRSNWRQYLEEFGMACRFYHSSVDPMVPSNSANAGGATMGPVEIGPSVADIVPTAAWTNFEEKYWLVGERTYELVVATSPPLPLKTRSQEQATY